MDPSTDQFLELTIYQYTSDEPIANIDMDGLEGGSAVLGHVGDAVVTSSSFMPDIAVQGLSKAVVAQKSINALNIGLDVTKVLGNVVDHTRNVLTIPNRNIPVHMGESVEVKMIDGIGNAMSNGPRTINDFFKRINNGPGTTPVGSGSHQKIGIFIDGGNGYLDNYSDKADYLTDYIHLSPNFFGMVKGFKLSVTEDAITNETVKKVVKTADAVSNAGKKVYEAVSGNNETRVTRGSGGRQVTKTVWVIKYKIGPRGDTLGNSIDPVNVPTN